MPKFPRYKFTSESVCAGHPDKICDQISDAILDEVYKEDRYGRVAVETLVTKNKVVVAGEVTTDSDVDYESVARNVIEKLGYVHDEYGFSHRSEIDVHIHTQSPEIYAGVKKKGAGDQGMMFGYACKETEELMPLPILLAHRLTELIDRSRELENICFLRPDGKSQVTVLYENGTPVKVTDVVIAVPHEEQVDLQEVKDVIYRDVVCKVLSEYGYSVDPKNLIVNGTGIWHKGGPASDTGLTGRKIIVDSYGGYAKVGGGAFSGKDPTKVDRSGAYAARYIAKNIVAQGLADRAEVGLAYFIGARKPLMQEIETFGTEKVSKKVLNSFANELMDTSVEGIIAGLDLRRPIYLKTAAYGHFGRECFPWEEVGKKISGS
jgi:S-adenosylmethionine synthetase